MMAFDVSDYLRGTALIRRVCNKVLKRLPPWDVMSLLLLTVRHFVPEIQTHTQPCSWNCSKQTIHSSLVRGREIRDMLFEFKSSTKCWTSHSHVVGNTMLYSIGQSMKQRVASMPTLSLLMVPEVVVDNLRCHQWRQSWHHDNSRFSRMFQRDWI